MIGASTAAFANTTVSWTQALTGGWSNPARWSTGVVPNAFDVDAVINATGSPYTVGLDQSVSVHSVTLNSPNARIDSTRTFAFVPGDATSGLFVNAGSVSIFSSGGLSDGRLINNGGTVSLAACSLTNMTLGGAITGSATVAQVNGNLTLENATWDVPTAGRIVLNGPSPVSILGTGTIRLGPSATIDSAQQSQNITIGPGVVISGTGIFGGGTGTRLIQGTIADGVTLSTPGATYTNAGTFEATNNSLTISSSVTMTNYAAGTLSGGTWVARNGKTLALGRSMTTNDATVIMDGAASRIIGLDLRGNRGSIILSGGQALSATALPNFINSGTVLTSTGASFTVPNTFTNTGLYSATNGGVFELGTNLVNNGTIAMSNATLRVRSSAAIANATGTFTVASGTLEMATGSTFNPSHVNAFGALSPDPMQLDLSSGSFDLQSGAWPTVGPKFNTRLTGATIVNGAITSPDGSPLLVMRGPSALVNVTMQADAVLADFAGLNLINTTEVGRRFRLDGNARNTLLRSNDIIGSNAVGAAPTTIEFANGGGTSNGNRFNTVRAIDPGETVTLGANVRLATTTGSGTIGFPIGTLSNFGTITATGAGRTLDVSGTFNNQGTVVASNGASVTLGTPSFQNVAQVPGGPTWTNTGTLRVDAGGTLMLQGVVRTADLGTIVNTGGGTIGLSGYINNNGSTLALNSSRGSWELVATWIDGGTLTSSGGTQFVAGPGRQNYFTSVHNAGTIAAATSAASDSLLAFYGPSGNSGSIRGAIALYNRGGTFNNTGSIDATGTGSFINSGTIVIRDGGSLRSLSSYWQVGGPSSQMLTSVGPNGTFSTGGVSLDDGLFRVENGGTVNSSTYFNVDARARLEFVGGSLHAGSMTVSGTVFVGPNTASPLRVGALVVESTTSGLDLSGGDMIVGAGTPKNTIVGYVKNAYHDGAWDRPGITSTAARDNPNGNTTIGVLSGQEYFDNNGASTFDGVAVNATDTLVKYTYFGDVDFNGVVDVSDYNLIDFGFVNHLTGWANGDADYSGGVDVSDYNLIDFAFSTQNGTVLRAIQYLDGTDRSARGMDADPSLQQVVKHFDQFGVVYAQGFLAAVPEPTCAVSLAPLAALLLRRRRRDLV